MDSQSLIQENSGPRKLRLHRLLAISLFLLLLFLSVAQAFYVFNEVQRAAREASVMTAANIGDHFLRSLSADVHASGENVLNDSQGVRFLQRASQEFSDMAVDTDLYVVSNKGEIQATISPQNLQRRTINVTPLENFLKLPRHDLPLLFGDDPSRVNGQSPFYVARIPGLKDSPYLYVVLDRTYLLRALRFRFDEYLPRLAAFTLFAQILLALGSAWFIRKLLTGRIRELSQTLGSYRRGEFSRRIEVKGRDEISELADVANSMAERIQRSIEQLEERDMLRRELIANVSHDLRTPASVLQGYSSLLNDPQRELAPGEREKVYSAIYTGSLALSRLLDQLWDLSRLEAKERVPEKQDFCIGELISEIVEQLQEKARQKGISLSEIIPTTALVVNADPSLITRVITNLIENAIFYTPEDGRISVEVIAGSTSVQVLVRDSGAGVSESDLPKILLRSFRGSSGESTNDKAAGLGLAIVSRILDLHGTSLQVASMEKQGSTFGFELPRAN